MPDHKSELSDAVPGKVDLQILGKVVQVEVVRSVGLLHEDQPFAISALPGGGNHEAAPGMKGNHFEWSLEASTHGAHDPEVFLAGLPLEKAAVRDNGPAVATFRVKYGRADLVA